MTIADAFNEITIAQGGTPNYSGTIASAIDALNDALAGSDQPAETTIEGAVRLLGQHIGGSVSGTIEITENGEGIDVAQYAYADVNVSGGGGDVSTATVTYTMTGGKDSLYVEAAVAEENGSGKCSYPFFSSEEISGSFTVLLFGGKALTSFLESLVTVVSGDAEAEGDRLTITGDCTVTVEPD